MFVDVHLRSWTLSVHNCADKNKLRTSLWHAARDILYSVEGLKLMIQPSSDGKGDFFAQLTSTCKDEPVAVLSICHNLFADQLAAAKTHRASLSQWKVDFSVARSYKAFETICARSIDTTHGCVALLNLLRVLLDNQSVLSGNTELIGVLQVTALWALTKLDQTCA